MQIRVPLVMILLVGIAKTFSACAVGPELDLTLHESDRATVSLERIPDRSFHATHPITLSTETMARVFRGILIKDNQRLLQGLIVGKSAAVPVFGDEEVAYLAPLLASGLTRAASDQQVGFRILHDGSPGVSPGTGAESGSSAPPLTRSPQETTKGSLYAYGRSLYVTITEYRLRADRTSTSNLSSKRLPDSTGLADKTVAFTPESASLPGSYKTGLSMASTLAIAYDVLVRSPAPSEMQKAGDQASPTPSRGETVQRDSELEALRKELQDIKKKLVEQEAERNRSTAPPKPLP